MQSALRPAARTVRLVTSSWADLICCSRWAHVSGRWDVSERCWAVTGTTSTSSNERPHPAMILKRMGLPFLRGADLGKMPPQRRHSTHFQINEYRPRPMRLCEKVHAVTPGRG
jgi:hypothetical protein